MDETKEARLIALARQVVAVTRARRLAEGQVHRPAPQPASASVQLYPPTTESTLEAVGMLSCHQHSFPDTTSSCVDDIPYPRESDTCHRCSGVTTAEDAVRCENRCGRCIKSLMS